MATSRSPDGNEGSASERSGSGSTWSSSTGALRCLVIIDLKLGEFTHADAGQMHLYLNYARQHWMVPGENPPVGLILCTSKEDAVVRYAIEGLATKVLATEYRTTLPKERVIADALARTRRQLESRRALRSGRRRSRM